MKKVLLYYHTLRYLKPIQIWYRLTRFLLPMKLSYLPKKVEPHLRDNLKGWNQIIVPKSSLLSEKPLTFVFLNQEGSLGEKEDWNSSYKDKLWLYNLHYMSYLLSDVSLALKQHLINRWINENPRGIGIGWDPYPLSLRIQNWIKFSLLNGSQDSFFNQSLYLQCLTLEKTIEYHLLGNHLFENAKALVFAGVYFDTEDSKRWLKLGCKILHKELKEQILEDGGHFERSPMYHSIILEGVLDLYQLTTLFRIESLQTELKRVIPVMLLWLETLTHRDENIAFFNDTTFDIAPNPQELFTYGEILGFKTKKQNQKMTYLKNSGIMRAQNKNILLLADIGTVGPSYLPGHAHAGTLSFEVSIGEDRLFVNRGISTYKSNAERSLQRGTLAHNTLSINGKDSSEVWSSFRVGRRARVFDVNYDESKLEFSAAHDGFHRFPSKVTHGRKWVIQNKSLLIEDTLSGRDKINHVSSYHLHPDWRVDKQDKNVFELLSSKTSQRVKVKFPENSEILITPYDYAIGFNKKKEGICLSLVSRETSLPNRTTVEVGL